MVRSLASTAPRPELLKEARKAADDNDLKLLLLRWEWEKFGLRGDDGSETPSTFVVNLAKLLDKKKLIRQHNWEYRLPSRRAMRRALVRARPEAVWRRRVERCRTLLPW